MIALRLQIEPRADLELPERFGCSNETSLRKKREPFFSVIWYVILPSAEKAGYTSLNVQRSSQLVTTSQRSQSGYVFHSPSPKSATAPTPRDAPIV